MAASIDNLEVNVTGAGFNYNPTLSGPIQGPDPVHAADLTTRSWVLGAIAGGGIVYTADPPISVVAANISMTPAGLGAFGYVTTGAQSFAGVKTFSNLPKIPLVPVANTDASSKGYVDTTVADIISGIGAMTATAPLDLSAGVISMPPANSGASGYLTFGAQDIGGVKTFSDLPTIPLTPLANTDAASKGYVDSFIPFTAKTTPTLSGPVPNTVVTLKFVRANGFVHVSFSGLGNTAQNASAAVTLDATAVPVSCIPTNYTQTLIEAGDAGTYAAASFTVNLDGSISIYKMNVLAGAFSGAGALSLTRTGFTYAVNNL